MKKDILKNLFAGISSVLILVMVLSNILQPKSTPSNFTYSELVQHVKDDAVKSIVIYHDHSVTGNLKNEKPFKSYLPMQDPRFLDALLSKNIIVKAEPPYRGVWLSIVMSWVPTVLHLGILIFFMRKATAAVGKGAFSFGGSKARSIEKGEIKVTFKDVAGIDEAKSEVTDLVEFLKNPKKVHKLGGRMPRGVLLGGEPGTGKTLLAKAVAGEANVPFFTISGSNFVEMFVGVGASRVRAMFEQAKKSAPCIIFIDEIDAVGRHRGAGMGGGHEEREQTLNQLLVEMDGFSDNESVIVMAATNRPDVLDKALLRPGRFDRQVLINLPDIQGRYQILQVHLKKVKFAESAVDPLILAKGTPGMSGADLQNMVNEAALQAARLNLETIDMAAFEKAKDKILMGAERPMLMSPEDKKVTAYHEAGHAIIGFHMIPKGHDPIHKVTIMPRGRALGVTMFLPDKDSYNYTKQRLEANLSSLFGGRIAEALIFGKEHITTGASNDIERATQLARNMVMQWGLSEKLGPLHYHDENESISGETKQSIEKEIRSIIDHCYQIAQKILEDNIDILHNMAEALVQHETINAQQVETLMRRESLTIIEEPTVNSLSNTEEEQAIKDLDAVSTT